jgi:DNA polymerase III alpha subunit
LAVERVREEGERESEYNHLLVLAENEEGYRNLIRLTSEASLHGFYRKPRVSKKYLAENCKGLIGFSGCLSGELCEALMAADYEKGKSAVAQQYQDIFGKGNFFLEIQDQGLETKKDSRRPVSAWSASWTFRWSPRTTRTTCAAKTRTRTM